MCIRIHLANRTNNLIIHAHNTHSYLWMGREKKKIDCGLLARRKTKRTRIRNLKCPNTGHGYLRVIWKRIKCYRFLFVVFNYIDSMARLLLACIWNGLQYQFTPTASSIDSFFFFFQNAQLQWMTKWYGHNKSWTIYSFEIETIIILKW